MTARYKIDLLFEEYPQDNSVAGWNKRELPAARAAAQWKELASKPWPTDPDEARARAKELNRLQSIIKT